MQAWLLSTFLTTSCSAWLPATQHSDQGTCRSSIKDSKSRFSAHCQSGQGGGGGGGEFTANENSPPHRIKEYDVIVYS